MPSLSTAVAFAVPCQKPTHAGKWLFSGGKFFFLCAVICSCCRTPQCNTLLLHWSDPSFLNLSFVYVEACLEATAQMLLNSTVKCFYNLFLRLNFIGGKLSEQWLPVSNGFVYIWSDPFQIYKQFCSTVSVSLQRHITPTWVLFTRINNALPVWRRMEVQPV